MKYISQNQSGPVPSLPTLAARLPPCCLPALSEGLLYCELAAGGPERTRFEQQARGE